MQKSSEVDAGRVRLGDVSESEHREVLASGLALDEYSGLRRVGASHHEVMEAHLLGADLRVYAALRAEYPHRHALDEATGANLALVPVE